MDFVKIRFAILSNRYIGKFLIACNYKKLSSYTSARWGGETFDSEICRCFEIFLSSKEKKNVELLRKLKIDIIWCYYRYGTTPDEFFLFDFRHCTLDRRSEFLTTKHKDDVMRQKVGFGDKWTLLEDKYVFYKNFGQFFKRDVLLMDEDITESDFENFVKKHPKFIAKPIGGQCGRGIELIDTNDYSNDVSKIFSYLHCKGLKYNIEELIKQVPEMEAINHSSVNTVRLPTFMNKSGFHVLKPFFRMGRKGAIVDNASSGGVFCVIDEKTGTLLTDAMDKNGVFYETHPDSNHELKGWVIPKWNELIEFARQVHGTIPNYPYVGWDFALTDNGWVLVEGNWGQFVSEYADKEGIKKKFDSLFD